MGLILVGRTDTLGVNYNDIQFLPLCGLSFDGGSPTPQPLRAGKHGGSHPKSITAIEEHLIEEVGFAGAVKPSNRNHSNRPWDAPEELRSLSREVVAYFSIQWYFRFPHSR